MEGDTEATSRLSATETRKTSVQRRGTESSGKGMGTNRSEQPSRAVSRANIRQKKNISDGAEAHRSSNPDPRARFSIQNLLSKRSRLPSTHKRLQKIRRSRSLRQSSRLSLRISFHESVKTVAQGEGQLPQTVQILLPQPNIIFPWQRPHKGESIDQLHSSGFFSRVPLPKKKLVRTPATLTLSTKRLSYRPGSMILTPTNFYHKANTRSNRDSRRTLLSQKWVTAAMLSSLRDETAPNSPTRVSQAPSIGSDTYPGLLDEDRSSQIFDSLISAPTDQGELSKQRISRATIIEDQHEVTSAAAAETQQRMSLTMNKLPHIDEEVDLEASASILEGLVDSEESVLVGTSLSGVSPVDSLLSQYGATMGSHSSIDENIKTQGVKISSVTYRHGSIKLERGQSVASSRIASVISLDPWTTILPNEEQHVGDDAAIRSIVEFFGDSSMGTMAPSCSTSSRSSKSTTSRTQTPRRPESAPVMDTFLATQNHAFEVNRPVRSMSKTTSLPLRLGSWSGKRIAVKASSENEGLAASRPQSRSSLLWWLRA